jgi:AcrR family transcriptional regulator
VWARKKRHLQTDWLVYAPGMARVRDPKATRRRILAAAHEEFWRRGYRAGSLNGIVEAAGVTKGALFHHFRDKNALALAVVEEVLAPELRDCWLVPLEGDGDALELLGRLLAGLIDKTRWFELRQDAARWAGEVQRSPNCGFSILKV